MRAARGIPFAKVLFVEAQLLMLEELQGRLVLLSSAAIAGMGAPAVGPISVHDHVPSKMAGFLAQRASRRLELSLKYLLAQKCQTSHHIEEYT